MNMIQGIENIVASSEISPVGKITNAVLVTSTPGKTCYRHHVTVCETGWWDSQLTDEPNGRNICIKSYSNMITLTDYDKQTLST